MSPVTFENLLCRISPRYVRIVDHKWLKNKMMKDFGVPMLFFKQLEYDLGELEKKVTFEKLKSEYQSMLRNPSEILETIYEIHCGALLASFANNLDVHPLKGYRSSRKYDFQVVIEEFKVNVDTKTRKDKFLFKSPSKGWHSRSVLDPHEATDLGIEQKAEHEKDHNPTPENTVIRQVLQDALSQLPEFGCNVVFFGQEEGGLGFQHLEYALYGVPVFNRKVDLNRKTVSFEKTTSPTGIFKSNDFKKLSGICWFSLAIVRKKLYKAYKFYVNPFAENEIPSSFIESFLKTILKLQDPYMLIPDLPRGADLLLALQDKVPSEQYNSLRSEFTVINPELNIKPQNWWVDSFQWFVAINLVPGEKYGPFYRHGQKEFKPIIGTPSIGDSERQCFFGLVKAETPGEVEHLYNLRKNTHVECAQEFTITVPNDCQDAYLFCGPVKSGTGFQINPNRKTCDLIRGLIEKGEIKRHDIIG